MGQFEYRFYIIESYQSLNSDNVTSLVQNKASHFLFCFCLENSYRNEINNVPHVNRKNVELFKKASETLKTPVSKSMNQG